MLKFPEFARVFALSGLAAAAVVVVNAQQPAAPAPPKTVPGTPAPAAPAAAPESKVAEDAVVLTIGDRKITRAQFEQLIAAVAPNAATPAAKRKIAEQYGDLETMAQEARKRMLDQSADAKLLVSIQTDNVLANILAKKITDETQLTDQDLRAYYDSHKDEYHEARGSHILIRFKGAKIPLKPGEKDLTDEEALTKAKDLRTKIIAGADFATLAKAESDDSGSAAKGGDLGTFKRGQMVAPFDKAAFSTPIGEVSEPVKSDFGYHIIKITSRDTFEDAKADIESQLKPKMARDGLEKIKAQSPVTLNDDYFGK